MGKELGEQSKKIITKKYGEDMVNTITAPVEPEKKEEEEGTEKKQELKEEETQVELADPQPVKREVKEEGESQVRLGESAENNYPEL